MKLRIKKPSNKDAINANEGKSNALKVKKLKEMEIDQGQVEEVSQTTNAMNIILSGTKEVSKGREKSLQGSRELISKNYDLASRKIIATHSHVIATGSFITTQYLSVQLALYLYEKDYDIKNIDKSITRFIEETWKKVAEGMTVAYTEEIVFEPVVYINKILPGVTMTPDIVRLVNAVTWEDIYNDLHSNNQLEISDKELYETLVKIIAENTNQGYYIQLNDVILIKIKIGASDNILIFSDKTLKWFNLEYKKFRTKINKKDFLATDNINHYQRTKNNINAELERNAKKAEEPKEEKPEENKTEEPKVEKPEENKTEEPKVEKPEDNKAEEPKVEKPEDNKAEEPKEEKPEDNKAEEPKEEKPEDNKTKKDSKKKKPKSKK